MFRRFKYDIAISVAEEDLEVANTIARSLKAKRVSYYFYTEQSVENWGHHILKISLSKFGAEAKYVLVIISKNFISKYWATMESQIIQVFKPGKDIYILPLRIDDTAVDGISKYIAFVKWERNEEEIADKIKRKIKLRNRAEHRRIAKFFGIFLVCLAALYFLVPKNTVAVDYSRYLEFIKRGDSLVQANNFPAAKEVYNQALRYNPKDTSVSKKLALLDSADRSVARKDNSTAQKLFQLILNIPASQGLSPQALEHANVSTNPPLTIEITWEAASLKITISGGVPFQNEKQPYLIEGIGCTGCVKWTKKESGYIASVESRQVKPGSIQMKDRLGQFITHDVPSNPFSFAVNKTNKQSDSAQTSSTPTAKNYSGEEAFTGYVKTGDSLFSEKKYKDAKEEYVLAKGIKPQDAGVAKKIALCDGKLRETEELAAKNIAKVTVPAGSFTMGTDNGNPDDGPEHSVAINAFIISKTEVTVSQYKLFCQFTGRQMPPEPPFGWYDDNPVVNITWADAMAYCQWVNGRLPNEAEWEYAAYARSTSLYSGGTQADNTAWYSNNSGGKPHTVARKSANAFGLYDMTGNVWEWCTDWYARKYYSQSAREDPKGPASGSEKVIRGGAYNSFTNSAQDGNQLRITYRNSEVPSARKPYIGFRVVWDK